MFPGLAEPEVQRFLDGSARITLKVDPCFHRFTFIEKDPRKVKELEKLRGEFPDKADSHRDAGTPTSGFRLSAERSGKTGERFSSSNLGTPWGVLSSVIGPDCLRVWLTRTRR